MQCYDDASFIDHALGCGSGQFLSSTGISYSSRHNAIKDEVLLRIPRRYGIPCVDEPRTYVNYYEDGHAGRPDVEYSTHPHLAVDLSIVHTPEHSQVGVKARGKRQEKLRKHTAAVTAVGHYFSPFVIETSGHVDQGAIDIISTLSRQLLPWMRPFFNEDFKRALTVSLVRQKVSAVRAAIQKHSVQNRRIEDI